MSDTRLIERWLPIAALGSWRPEGQRAALSWMTRDGPFWEDTGLRRHSSDDYLECRGDVVTDSAIGEAAYRALHRVESGLVSLAPSDWLCSPIEVVWHRDDGGSKTASLENWWCVDTFKIGLQAAAPPIRSWSDLRNASIDRFGGLIFAKDCFKLLTGIPFAKGAADGFLKLLDILDKLATAFDATGARTAEGHWLYRNYFTGRNALFSDSSDSEKRGFCEKLTFPHPCNPGKSLFCPWHGKVRSKRLRLHFSWPPESGKPLYVVYAGHKITKR